MNQENSNTILNNNSENKDGQSSWSWGNVFIKLTAPAVGGVAGGTFGTGIGFVIGGPVGAGLGFGVGIISGVFGGIKASQTLSNKM